MTRKSAASKHPGACSCGAADCPSSGGPFLVVATRRKEDFTIAGPFDTAADALEVLPRAWLFFWKLNPRNAYRWSIVKDLDSPPYPIGILNEQLGVSTHRRVEQRVT